MSFKPRIYLLAISLLFLGSCSTKYALVKSNRAEYNINKDVAVDSSIIKLYLPYKTQLDVEMNTVIGHSAVTLAKQTNTPESVLGNFFADAVLQQALKITSNIDFVFPTTKGGLRNDIEKGPITVAAVFELMPFENQLVLIELKGSDVLNVLNFIAGTDGQPVARLKMNIKDRKAEQVIINGKPFDVNKNYFVLTSDYIANGGDDSKGFSNPVSRKNIGLLVRDALLNEVKETEKSGKEINTKLDGRITKN